MTTPAGTSIGAAAGMQTTRVLYVINNFNRGGAELGLIRLVKGGAFSGCELRIVSIVRGSGEPIAALGDAGADVECLSSRRRMRRRDWLVSVPKLIGRIIRFRPHVVVLSLPQANIAGRTAVRLARPMLSRRPVVASFEHNTHLSKSIFERLYRLTSPIVDWLVSDSKTTAAEAQARLYRVTPGRVVILPLISFADDMHAINSGTRFFTIASAARFTPVKNQESIILAVNLLKSQGRIVRVMLFGEGEGRQSCARLVQSLALEHQVSFMGYSPDWVEHPADVFVVASLHEGLCIAALEAMSRGLPVIATRVGGLNDYGDEAQVMFADNSGPQALAQAIASLMDDPIRRESMAVAGRQLVKRRFSDARTREIYSEFSKSLRSLPLATDGNQGAGSRRRDSAA
jgi:glycosyltransferase involved in cell wall biosynthesis